VQNKYGFAELTERFGNSQMPEMELIDLKKIPKTDKNKIILSPQMKEAIAENVNRNKQVILFQNRRGYSPYVACLVCGWIPHCDNCDVSLTYHKSTSKLQCHYCGSLYPLVKTCIACGSQEFAQRNFGTERIEETIDEELVNIKTARMDVDSVRGKHGHEALISMFEQRRVDVLVGTQMVVKGLDFDHVGLVGILDADAILNYADFRVNERAFQLMEQVSGRAGRKLDRGKVLIQVSNTAHPLLPVIQSHNYKLFFDVEIEYRKQYAYPPFSRLIKIQCKHRYKNIAEQASRLLAEKLQPRYGEFIIGPAEPFVSRIRNMFIHELMLKLPTQPALLQRCKQQLRQYIIDLRHEKNYSSVHVIVDVDPV
jgi:primosomal protein N' (replication factor Y) (superfamily II helicase)